MEIQKQLQVKSADDPKNEADGLFESMPCKTLKSLQNLLTKISSDTNFTHLVNFTKYYIFSLTALRCNLDCLQMCTPPLRLITAIVLRLTFFDFQQAKRLRILHSHNLKNYVYAVCKKIFTQELAAQFNQKGTKDSTGKILKHAYLNLRAIKLIEGITFFVNYSSHLFSKLILLTYCIETVLFKSAKNVTNPPANLKDLKNFIHNFFRWAPGNSRKKSFEDQPSRYNKFYPFPIILFHHYIMIHTRLNVR